MKSQNERIKAYLKPFGRSLTSLKALKLFGCFRLASRINDLRDEGIQIRKETILTKSGKRIAKYYMP